MTPVTRSERALIISRIPAGEFSFDNLDALGSLITQELTNILVEQAGADREVWERLALGEDVEPTLGSGARWTRKSFFRPRRWAG